MKTAAKHVTVLLTLVSLILTAAAIATEDTPPVRHNQQVYKTVGKAKLTIHSFAHEDALERDAHAAIVIIHGGGWAFGEPSVFFAACRRYASMGLTTFSVQYCLAENPDGDIESPKLTPIECVLDVRSALRWVRAHANEFNIDPHRIAAGGHSVGGQLSLATADLGIMRLYASLVEEDAIRNRILGLIEAEYERTRVALEEIYGGALSEQRPSIHRLLEPRKEGLRLLHAQQVELLRCWRTAPAEQRETILPLLLLAVNAIAGGLRTTG